jgi:2-methylisocitrate lyase-like PEP mutase family enzyme
MRDALERGRAYLDAGAPAIFVPAILGDEDVQRLVAEFGDKRLTLIGIPGLPPPARLEELGVARLSYGPISQNVALTALQDMAVGAQHGHGAPEFRILN